jgi:hypothetical protein
MAALRRAATGYEGGESMITYQSLIQSLITDGEFSSLDRFTLVWPPRDNAELIAVVCTIYVANGMRVADVTFGMGVFWTKTDTSRFELLATDIRVMPNCRQADCRQLPYADGSIDVVVLDPPYIHNPSKHQKTDARYGNAETTKGLNHAGIIRLYADGIQEAARVLKAGGQLWVKCKDEIESGKQRWSHIELYHIAIGLGFYAQDLCVPVPTSRPPCNRWKRQLHARKVHSYLWVFNCRRRRQRRRLLRY